MYERLVRYVYYPCLDFLKRERVLSCLKELEASQYWSRDQLDNIQSERLRVLLRHAAAYVPYYRTRWSSWGLDPVVSDPRETLSRIPWLSKQELYDHRADLFSERWSGRRWIVSTSGSTGIATRFAFDSLHESYVKASYWRGRGWWGVRLGDREVDLWGRPVASRFRRAAVGLKQRLRNVLHINTFQNLSPERLEAFCGMIERFDPVLIYAYGSSLYRLAQHIADRPRRLHLRSLKVIEYTADTLFQGQREEIERIFCVPVLSAYGATEAGGLAETCPHGRLHLSVEHILMEVLGPDGQAVSPGVVGEIVVTCLHNLAAPLLRYRLGDLGSLDPDPCRCGRTLPTMSLTVGKVIDMIRTSTGTVFSSHLFDYINIALMRQGIRGIRQFKVWQRSLDDFELWLVSDGHAPEPAVAFFLDMMHRHLGEQISIQVRWVAQIPLEPTGKLRYFVPYQPEAVCAGS